jgi:hypothetical protein
MAGGGRIEAGRPNAYVAPKDLKAVEATRWRTRERIGSRWRRRRRQSRPATASARAGVAVRLISLMFKYRILSLFRNM